VADSGPGDNWLSDNERRAKAYALMDDSGGWGEDTPYPHAPGVPVYGIGDVAPDGRVFPTRGPKRDATSLRLKTEDELEQFKQALVDEQDDHAKDIIRYRKELAELDSWIARAWRKVKS